MENNFVLCRRQPLLLNFLIFLQPRASASTPFSVIRWHQETLTSRIFYNFNFLNNSSCNLNLNLLDIHQTRIWVKDQKSANKTREKSAGACCNVCWAAQWQRRWFFYIRLSLNVQCYGSVEQEFESIDRQHFGSLLTTNISRIHHSAVKCSR